MVNFVSIILFVFTFQAIAASREIEAIVAAEKDGGTESFISTLTTIKREVDNYNNRELARRGILNTVRYGKNAIASYVDMVPGGGTILKSIVGTLSKNMTVVADLATDAIIDGFDYLTEAGVENQYNEAVKGALFQFYESDKKRFERVFSIQDPRKRSVEVYKAIDELDCFNHVAPRNTDERAVFNSRAIISLIEITKGLTAQVFKNTEEIEKLKEGQNAFRAYLQSNGKEFRLFLKTKAEERKAAIDVTDRGVEMNRSIASIAEEGENISANPRSGHQSTFAKDEQSTKEFKEQFTKFMESTTRWVEAANKTYQVALNLGMKGQDAERAGKVIRYVNVAAQTGMGVAQGMNGNPMGFLDAAVSISSLFAKQQKSPEQERHEQMMEMFGEVFRSQRQILENQRVMFDLQKETYKLLTQIYKLEQEQTIFLSEKFKTVLGNQAALLSSVVSFSEIHGDLKKCESFLNSRFRCNPAFLSSESDLKRCFEEINATRGLVQSYHNDFVADSKRYSSVLITGNFSSYVSLGKHFNEITNKKNYVLCKRGLDAVFSNSTHDILLAKSHVSPRDHSTIYESIVEPIYEPLWNLVKKVYSKNPVGIKAFYYALLFPTDHFDGIEYKVTSAITHLRKEDSRLSTEQVEKALNHMNMLYVPAVERYATYLLEMISYFDIVDEGWFNGIPTLYTADQVLESNTTEVSSETQNKLYAAVKLINVAIAQQSMISGDTTIGMISSILERGSTDRLYYDAVDVLKNNEYLARNLLVYQLRKSLVYSRGPGEGALSYDAIFTKRLAEYNRFDDKRLQELIGFEAKVENKHITFKDLHQRSFTFALPDSKEIKDGELLHTPLMYKLISIRNELMQTIYLMPDAYRFSVGSNLYR